MLITIGWFLIGVTIGVIQGIVMCAKTYYDAIKLSADTKEPIVIDGVSYHVVKGWWNG